MPNWKSWIQASFILMLFLVSCSIAPKASIHLRTVYNSWWMAKPCTALAVTFTGRAQCSELQATFVSGIARKNLGFAGTSYSGSWSIVWGLKWTLCSAVIHLDNNRTELRRDASYAELVDIIVNNGEKSLIFWIHRCWRVCFSQVLWLNFLHPVRIGDLGLSVASGFGKIKC
jgi:hypothetical protein